jgi:hypothetical protein
MAPGTGIRMAFSTEVIGAVTMRRDFVEVKPQRNARCGLA